MGVLAIIGVLSVGAISGYSKAMEKYKVNRAIEQLNHIVNEAFIHLHDFNYNQYDGNGHFVLIPYFIKMRIIPENMISTKQDDEYVYDALGNSISVVIHYRALNTYVLLRFNHVRYKNATAIQCYEFLMLLRSAYYDYINTINLDIKDTPTYFFRGAQNKNTRYEDLRSVTPHHIREVCQDIVRESNFAIYAHFK